MDENFLDGLISAWNGTDPDAVLSFFAPDKISYTDVAMGHTMTGNDEVRTFISDFFNNNASHRFEKISASFSKTSIAWEWRMIVERKNGNIVDVPGMSMMELKDGKILHNRDYWSRMAPPE